MNFVSITPQVIAAADKKPGYSDLLYWCLQADVETWAPTLSDGTPGATKKITGDHTLFAGKTVKTIQCKPKSIDGTADSQGEVGAAVITWKQKIIIKGDSATINEFFEGILNEDIVAWFNDPTCGVTNLIQFGSKCTPAQISSPTFRSGSRGAGGLKEHELVIECPDKFFYGGTLPEGGEEEPEPPTTIAVKFFYTDNGGVPTLTQINAGAPTVAMPGGVITIPTSPYFAEVGGQDKLRWIAIPKDEPAKLSWYNDSTNNGPIGIPGSGETFVGPVVVGDWDLYYTDEPTSFTGPVELRNT